MRTNPTWILVLILSCVLVTSRPAHDQQDTDDETNTQHNDYQAHSIPKHHGLEPQDEQVISVRITSSVAVGRGKAKPSKILDNKHSLSESLPIQNNAETTAPLTILEHISEENEKATTNIPPNLVGANIEFIKQLNSKKESRGLQNLENVHSFPSMMRNEYSNDTDDSIAESSVKSVMEIAEKNDENYENIDNVPLARSLSLSPSSKNYVQGLTHKQLSERGNSPLLTTVSFNIVHDTPKATSNYNELRETYVNPSQTLTNPPKFYEAPEFYNEPSKVYSQPAKVYSEPAKFYSEPAKIYSEPAKIYSEPSKVYSEPAKIYSEPAKFYSQPASLHLTPDTRVSRAPWHPPSQSSVLSSTIVSTTPITTVTNPSIINSARLLEQQPEKNYEVDEKISILTDGRSHGVQESTTESCKQENCKVGYVVEGRQYRKYRVEERTSDGFIVGEYGVVRNEDGALRGVRYTADGDASPRLIYDALMKFLQLK